MKNQKSYAIFIFLGALLSVFFLVGLVFANNPDAFFDPRREDITLIHFTRFCYQYGFYCGIVGLPMFVISLILSLVQEKKDSGR